MSLMNETRTFEQSLSHELDELGLLNKKQFINVYTRIFNDRRQAYLNWLSFLVNYSSTSYMLCHHLISEVHQRLSNLDPLIELDPKSILYAQQLIHQIFTKQSYHLPVTLAESKDYLVISILYARYPKLVRKSIEELGHIIQSKKPNRGRELFKCLFVEYEVPDFLIEKLSMLDTKELKLLMELVEGKSIRNCNAISVPISVRDIVHY